MSDLDLMQRLAAALAALQRPSLPIDIDLWDVATVAQYLKRDPDAVRARICCLPDFPRAIRLPSAQGRGQALYKASEVIKWAESYREKERRH